MLPFKQHCKEYFDTCRECWNAGHWRGILVCSGWMALYLVSYGLFAINIAVRIAWIVITGKGPDTWRRWKIYNAECKAQLAGEAERLDRLKNPEKYRHA